MKNAIPVQTDELVVSLAGRVQENRVDLIARYRRSLQENLFTNRTEVRPRELSAIAEEEADSLISTLPYPHLGVERGKKLCQMGLSEQTVLSLSHATRQFILAIFERDLIPLALDAADTYQNAVIRGFIQGREKIILAEQEQIRGALQIAVGRYTVEIKDIQALAQRTAESNEFKSRFIARISHELRTPLGALLGMSEMLQQNVYGALTPAQMDITQRIINNTHVLERTFAELLDQSQLESDVHVVRVQLCCFLQKRIRRHEPALIVIDESQLSDRTRIQRGQFEGVQIINLCVLILFGFERSVGLFEIAGCSCFF